MWTDESETSDLILRAVADPVEQRLLYQAQMHLESFRHASKQLKDSFDTLLFHDFARTQSCHMTEGIFGADIHLAKMESAKVRVWGFLLGAVSAGNKFLRCIVNARSKDRNPDWKKLRDDLKQLPDHFSRTRNFMEHLDEKVHRQEVSGVEDCKLSRYGVLIFTDDRGKAEFDFADDKLARIDQIWEIVIGLLKDRDIQKSRPSLDSDLASRDII